MSSKSKKKDILDEMIDGMSNKERQKLAQDLFKKLFEGMSNSDKKEFAEEFIPKSEPAEDPMSAMPNMVMSMMGVMCTKLMQDMVKDSANMGTGMGGENPMKQMQAMMQESGEMGDDNPMKRMQTMMKEMAAKAEETTIGSEPKDST